jgi:hypothetical protein
MKITNVLNLPEGLMNAVSTEKHNSKGAISATTLLRGTKEIILMDRHWDELEDDVSDRFWAILGTAVHALLENEGENEFSEVPLDFSVGNTKVTGRIDNYNLATGVICDYKTATVYKVKFQDYEDWYLQGMIYAWLLIKNGFKAKECRFIAMLKDFSKTEMERDHQYPRKPMSVYEFPVTLDKVMQIDEFIQNKISDYEHCLELSDDAIPPCSEKERWERPMKYAVRKEGRKTAVKLFDDEESAKARAEELGKGHYVEYRQGESVKCQNYCLCHDFCNYYRENVLPKLAGQAPESINAMPRIMPQTAEPQAQRLAA